MTIVIRPIQRRDLEAVLAMNDAAVPHVNRIDLAQMSKFREEAAYFRVALLNDTPAGFLVGLTPDADYASPNFHWFRGRYAKFAYIDRVAVAAHARRRGLAAALYRDFEAAFAAGNPPLACEVNLRPPNDASMLFHRTLGFRQVGSQIIDGGAKEVAMLIKEPERADRRRSA